MAIEPLSLPAMGRPGDRAEIVETVLGAVLDLPTPMPRDLTLTALGLDSVTAVRAQRELRAQTGVTMPLNAFLGATIDDLVGAVELADEDVEEPASPVRRPGTPSAPVADAPLTPVQAAYWVGRRPEMPFGGVSAFYYTEWSRRPSGDPLDDAHRLSAAWDQVVARHGALRTVVDERARQRVLPEVPADILDVVDLRGLPTEQAAPELDRLRHDWSHQVRPADRWPLFDVHAVLLPDGTMRVCLGTDAMILDLDGWSTVLRDWGLAYAAPGRALPRPDLDFPTALTLRDASRERRQGADADYWQRVLPELPAAPTLPWSAEPGRTGGHRFERRSHTLDPERWSALQDQARSRGLSATGVLMAAFSLVLSRWGAASPFTLATTVFDRPDDDLAVVGDWTTIGLTPVTPPALGSWDGFAGLAATVNRQFWADLEHGSVAASAVRRPHVETGGLPDHGVVFTSGLMDDADDPDAWLGEQVWGVSQTPQVLLDHFVDQRGGGLRVRWDSVQGVLPADLLDSMVDAEHRLLERLATDPEAWDDRTLGWDPTFRGEEPRHPSPFGDAGPLIADPWRQSAARTPDGVAVSGVVRGEDGDARDDVTHERLLELATRGAAVLRELGVGREVLVAVSLPKGPAQIAAIMAVSLAGGAYVPVDPTWPAERCEAICDQAGLTLALVRAGADDDRWPGQVQPVEVFGQGVLTVPVAEQRVRARRRPTEETRDEDLAYTIFTSGSTGRPKGVAIEHRAARTTIDEIVHRVPIGPGDAVLGLSAASFDLSVHDIFGVMGAGGTLVLPDPDRERDPDHWLDLCESHGVTVWNTAPALMEMLVEHSEFEPERARRALRTLKLVMLSGDWIPVTLPDRLKALAPDATFLSLGGATEAAIWSNTFEVREVAPDWPSIPYGRALPGQSFHIVGDDGDPVPAGEPGELQISGGGLARGYLGAPEQTAAAFGVEAGLGIRTYRTGDLGRWRHDGQMEFLGRKDRQVKIRGHRIELADVEAALARSQGVRAAVASSMPGPDGRPRLVAHVVATDPARPPVVHQMQEQLRERVPSYMVPASILVLDRLPLTPNGKVDGRALPNPYHRDGAATPAPTATTPAASTPAASTAAPSPAAEGATAPSTPLAWPGLSLPSAPEPVAPRTTVAPAGAAAVTRPTTPEAIAPEPIAPEPIASEPTTGRASTPAAGRLGSALEAALAAGLAAEVTLTASGDDLAGALIATGELLRRLPDETDYRLVGVEPLQLRVALPAGPVPACPVVDAPDPAAQQAAPTVVAPAALAGTAPTVTPAPETGRAARLRTVRREVADVLADLLGEPVADGTAFMDAGATSLTMVLMHGRLRQQPGFEQLQLMDLFDHPSTAALAEHLVDLDPGVDAPDGPVAPGSPAGPPTAAVPGAEPGGDPGARHTARTRRRAAREAMGGRR